MLDVSAGIESGAVPCGTFLQETLHQMNPILSVVERVFDNLSQNFIRSFAIGVMVDDGRGYLIAG